MAKTPVKTVSAKKVKPAVKVAQDKKAPIKTKKSYQTYAFLEKNCVRNIFNQNPLSVSLSLCDIRKIVQVKHLI